MTTTMRRDGVLYVAGKPPMDNLPTEIMFVATSVQEEEASEGHTSHYGMKFKQEAEYLRGPIGDMFKDVCGRAGIDIRKCYYTSVVKWLLPRAMRSKPAMKVMKWGMPVLLDEIKKAKPKIVVCLGKPAFDLLADTKIGFDDATGGWFWSTKANAHIYVMRSPTELLMKPELFEGFRVDLVEVKRKLDIINDVAGIEDLPVRIQTIRSAEELRDWVYQMQEEGHKLFSVDGEWHGNTHIDGNLRSLQLAWTDSDAIYIRFRNEQNEWDFDFEDDDMNLGYAMIDAAYSRLTVAGYDPAYEHTENTNAWQQAFAHERYLAVGKILQPLLNQPDVKYVGHHYVADALWMAHWLGLEVLHKCYMDTEFAQQTIDEASELKLERGISMKYTTLGRYDIDLILWKKKNKKLCEDGYGYVPDEIIIPYACLAWDSKVQLGDGSWEEIHKLVDRKYSGTVMALVDGEIVPCKVTNWKKSKKPGQKWFRLVTPSTKKVGKHWTGPRFTEDHKILTNEGYVRVDELDTKRHQIATAAYALTEDQRQIILGSMLGDGGLYQPNDAGVLFRCSQSGDGMPYAQWKADSLESVFTMRRDEVTYEDQRNDRLSFESPTHITLSNIAREFSRSDSQRGHFEITEHLLEEAGDLGLAVWAMDDGTLVGNTFRLVRRSASDEEVAAGLAYFRRRFGKSVKFHRSNGVFIFSHGAFWRLMDVIKPFMHPAKAHKHAEAEDILEPYEVFQDYSGNEYESIIDVVPADRPRGNKKMECFRYCLTVPEAGNFLTKVGFVSNCRDVLAVFRAVPFIRKQMHFQKLENYYDTIFGPFVTDVFYTFAEVGLPMDIPLMDELRELFNFAKRELDREFRQKVYKDAKQRLLAKLIEILGPIKMAQCLAITKDVVALVADGQHEEAWTCLKAEIPLDQMIPFRNLLDHLIISPDFNIRSAPDMRRWLFDVSGMTPIKSTNQKSKGMPSMDWSKVMELTKDKQALYTPACDKQTLQILAEKLPLVDELLDLNVVGNLCKAFLKEAETYWDEDLGEEVEEEAGLHKWLASNGRIHGQTSTTETGRPRGWRPNSLNWPSYVNKRIGKAMARVIAASVEAREVDMPNEERIKKGMPLPLPDSLMKWAFIKSERDIPSIRSIVKAPSGWCLTESDYQTAEIRGLAFISGDENLIRLMTEADPEWAFTKTGEKVRVAYADFKDSGIPKAKQDEKYFLGVWEDGKLIKQFTEDDLLRDEQTGEVIHCRYDLHWSLAEWTYEKPREEMVEKIHRAAGKEGRALLRPGKQQGLTMLEA